jgi:Purple acid Phosphatase, N-terminal domain
MKLLVKLPMTIMIASLLCLTLVSAQVSPTTKKAASVRIISGPEMERTDPDFAIIRWTSNNPGGSPVHYGVVHYGTNPKRLDQTAKSPIRLNPYHAQTVFRVRMEALQPNTTYYYMVDSMESNGTSDGVKSPVRKFSTPKTSESAQTSK